MNNDASAGSYADNVAFPSPQKILRRFRGGKQEISLLSVLVLRHEQVPEIRMVGQDIIHAGGFDDAAKGRVGPDIGYLFSQTPDLPAVIHTFKILFNCFDHGLLSSLLKKE
jgi:hypothetical protein